MAYTAAVMAAGRAASWHLALQARRFFFSNSSHNGTILLENQQKSWCYWILDCGFLIFLDVFSGYSVTFVRKWINLMITSLEKIQDPLRSLQKLSSLPRFQVKAGLWSWLEIFHTESWGVGNFNKKKSIRIDPWFVMIVFFKLPMFKRPLIWRSPAWRGSLQCSFGGLCAILGQGSRHGSHHFGSEGFYNTLGHIGGTVVSYKDTHQPLKWTVSIWLLWKLGRLEHLGGCSTSLRRNAVECNLAWWSECLGRTKNA